MADSHFSKAPAFQFYPNDFTTGTVDLSAEEVGVYIRFLCYQWAKGAVPADLDQQARIGGVSKRRMPAIWTRIRRHFVAYGRAAFVNGRLERVRQEQTAYRRRQSEKGKASAANRKSTGSQPEVNPTSTGEQPTTQPKGNSSFFNLQSSSSRREKNTSQSPDDALAERAARFLERYQALYQKHRHGAHYLVRPHLDFPKAKELCAVWPDERLDKLATIFLLTDHKFAEEGSRTIGQFAALASWCDGRLAEAGIA